MFSKIRLEPMIAYQGVVEAWLSDMEARNPFFTFWSLEHGEVTLSWVGGSRRIRSGECVLIPCGLRRRHAFSSGAKIVSLSFWAGWENGRQVLGLGAPLVGGRERATSLTRKVRLATESLPPHHDGLGNALLGPAAWMKFSANVYSAVAEILHWAHQRGAVWNLPQTGDVRLDKILDELSLRVSAGPLPFERWSAETGLSRVQLDRLARQHLGETLKARRDARLLQEILGSLSLGRESLKEIAARLDFFDPPHFTRWVRAHTGRNPKALRGSWL